MTEWDPRNTEHHGMGETDVGRREFVRKGLALGAGLMGTGCAARADPKATSPSAGTEGSTRRDPSGAKGLSAAGPGAQTVALDEDRFDLEVEGRVVPGILWRPAGAGAHTPLVLAGHGGGFGTAGHKRVEKIVLLAEALAGYGAATVAIDQPGCGDRPGSVEEQARRRTLTIEDAIESLWTPELVEEMARDWQGTLDYLSSEWGLGASGIGYWGLSGGTTFGVPLVALEPRIESAVLGLNGVVPLMLAYAPRVTCPLLYTVNLDDRYMTRDNCLALFDAFPSQDKYVLAYPGDHGEGLEPAIPEWARFFASRLGALSGESAPCGDLARGPMRA